MFLVFPAFPHFRCPCFSSSFFLPAISLGFPPFVGHLGAHFVVSLMCVWAKKISGGGGQVNK